ncbi:MAG: hypothetical protein KJP26_14800 [Maribacter sp.]|nr:hypothetical protein [Maribacter sp.]
MSLLVNPLTLKQLLKNNPENKGHYQSLNYRNGITYGLCDEELFIGSVFRSDLLLIQKNDEQILEAFYKRFSLLPTQEL